MTEISGKFRDSDEGEIKITTQIGRRYASDLLLPPAFLQMDLVIFNIVSSVNRQEAVTKLIPASRCSKVLRGGLETWLFLAAPQKKINLELLCENAHEFLSRILLMQWCNGSLV